MESKDCNKLEYHRQNRFHKKIMEQSFLLHKSWPENLCFRGAVQQIKENHRDGRSGGQKGRVFVGNSNKYFQGLPENRIQNRIQKRNELKLKYMSFY